MSPLHSKTNVPQRGPQRWWVRKGKTNSKPNTARRTRHNRPTSALEPDSWLQHRGATAAGQRHWTATALSWPRRKGTDPLTQFEHASWTRVKEALDKANIQAWFTQRDTTKHVLTHPSLDRKATISQTTFSNEFTWMKSFILWFNFYWCFFFRAQLTNKSALFNVGSVNGLAPNRRQAIAWHGSLSHKRVGMSWRGLTRINN